VVRERLDLVLIIALGLGVKSVFYFADHTAQRVIFILELEGSGLLVFVSGAGHVAAQEQRAQLLRSA
jgi:hypothetical protein